MWSIQGVLKYLQSLIDKSNILKTLEKEKQKQRYLLHLFFFFLYVKCASTNNLIISGAQTEEEKSEVFDFGSQTLFKMLGYFSIVGLCRVHCMLGDYYMALRVLSPIDFNKKGLYTKVIACYITLYYYMGFAYMMTRRFVDAIKTFSNVLLYISRTRQPHTKSYQHDLVRANYIERLSDMLTHPFFFLFFADRQEERANVRFVGYFDFFLPSTY